MGFDFVRARQRPIEQDTSREDEQPRFFECFQCVCNMWNMGKVSATEKRFICKILDEENLAITRANEQVINPAMRADLKRCIYHPEYNPETVEE